jgi:hypothetical protein
MIKKKALLYQLNKTADILIEIQKELKESIENYKNLQYNFDKLNFEIKNPPKYKIGDIIKGKLIIRVSLKEEDNCVPYMKNNSIIQKHFYTRSWEYYVFNIKTRKHSFIK